MEEKLYKTLGWMGSVNIALGIVTIVSGIACGTLLIVCGGRILSRKSKILF